MCASIENPASCEVRSVIRFLLAENHKPIEIHRRLCKVYGNNVMSEGGVWQWCIMFKNGRTNVHDNTRPHTANHTRELLDHFGWEVFDHPPYSPDLAPSDYHLFTNMTTWLATQCFDDDAELQAGVNE
jgi:hypothetical protein